jgi:hypothetical protein
MYPLEMLLFSLTLQIPGRFWFHLHVRDNHGDTSTGRLTSISKAFRFSPGNQFRWLSSIRRKSLTCRKSLTLPHLSLYRVHLTTVVNRTQSFSDDEHLLHYLI